MPGPFDITKWVRTTDVPVPSGSRTAGLFQSPDQRLVTSFDSFPTFFNDGAGMDWATGWQAVTYDNGSSWALGYNTMTAQPPGGHNQEAGRIGGLWTIKPPLGNRLFYRARVKFGKSTTADNGTIGAGYVKIDASVDGLSWWEQTTLLTWPQVNKGVVGGSGVATLNFGIGHVAIPGSGPNGANADWLIMSVRVRSHGVSLVEQIGMWRSDDFGFSWTFVRDLNNQAPWVDAGSEIGQLTRNTGSGRLHAVQISAARILYSDNIGVTWVDAPEPVNSGAAILEHCHGGTMVSVQGGTNHKSIISCDDGANWIDGVLIGSTVGGSGLAAKVIGAQEHLVIKTVDLTIMQSWYSDTGGESYTMTGERSDAGFILNEPNGLVRCPITGTFMVSTRLGHVAVTKQSAPGSFGTRASCPLANAGLAQAKAPALCGATIIPSRC